MLFYPVIQSTVTLHKLSLNYYSSLLLRWQVSVAVLIDRFISSSVELKAEAKAAQDAKIAVSVSLTSRLPAICERDTH